METYRKSYEINCGLLNKFVITSYSIHYTKLYDCGDFKFELYNENNNLVNELNFSTPCVSELGFSFDCSKSSELFPFDVIYLTQNDVEYPFIVVGKTDGHSPCNVYGIDKNGKLKEYNFNYGDYPSGNGSNNTMEFSYNFV